MSEQNKIIKLLKDTRAKSFCPASNFAVAAVIKTIDGELFVGTNVEEASWHSICAEKAAITAMVSAGGKKILSDIWVMGGPQSVTTGPLSVTPCGSCRQFLAEFSSPKTAIHCLDLDGKTVKTYMIDELLPAAVTFQQVKGQ